MTIHWQPEIVRSPDVPVVTPGAETTYRLTRVPARLAPNTSDGYRRAWVIVTPFANGTQRIRPIAGTNAVTLTWEETPDPADSSRVLPSVTHHIFCFITLTQPTEDPPESYHTTIIQTVAREAALHAVGRAMRAQDEVSPDDSERELSLKIACLDKIAEIGGVASSVRLRHRDERDRAQRQLDRMRELFRESGGRRRVPFRARYMATADQSQRPLFVFLCKLESRGSTRVWQLVDYSIGQGNVGNSKHEGNGVNDEAAIGDAIRRWDTENRYPVGSVSYNVPSAVTGGQPLQGRFRTDGETRSDTIIRYLGYTSFLLLPVGGALAVSGRAVLAAHALRVASLTSTAAGVISISQRWIAESREWGNADTLDVLGVLGNLLGIASARWVRAAMVRAPADATRARQLLNYALYADVTTTGAEGVLLAAVYSEEYLEILENQRLSPQERFGLLVRLLTNAAASGGLALVNIGGLRRDLRDLDAAPTHAPNAGDARAIRDRAEELADDAAEIDVSRPPGTEGHTDAGGATTRVHTRAPDAEVAAPRAILPDGTEAPPSQLGGFHGTDRMTAQQARAAFQADGLPAGGSDWGLYEHALGNPNSAFRGMTPRLQVAAGMADEGGIVFELARRDAWDVNQLLEPHASEAQLAAGQHGSPFRGEVEYATARGVEATEILRWGIVRRGRVEWQQTRGAD